MKRLFSVLFTLLFLSCCTVKTLVKTPNLYKQKFLKDSYSRIIIPHYVAVSNSTKHSGPPSEFHDRGKADTCWCDREDFAQLRRWGFNGIRHEWHWEGIEPSKDFIDTSYVNRKLKRVRWAGAESLSVIVDLHQDVYAQRLCGNGFPDWTVRDNGIEFGGCTDPWNLAYLDPAVVATWNNFWNNDTLIDEYIEMMDYVFSVVDTIPYVLGVEIMNEPFPDLSGKFEQRTLTKFYRRIYDMREEKGYKKLIFFGPWMSTSSGLSSCLKNIGSERIVYVPHYYDLQVDAHKPYGTANYLLMKRAIPGKLYEAQGFDCPMMILEFGARPNYQKYLKDFLDICDANRIGWGYYSYDTPNHCSFTFIDMDKQPNETLKTLSRVYPQLIAGTGPKFGIKNDVFTLTYNTFTKIEQPTIIYIPERLNVTVETEGKFDKHARHMVYYNTEEWNQKIVIRW